MVQGVHGLELTVRVQRGDHIIPNLHECFPVKEQESGEGSESKDYYTEAMARGLGSRLAQPMFTTCGKIQVKVPKYNNPKQLYGEAVMEEMISGTSVDPEKLDPDSEAFKKRSEVPKFDPQQSSVLAVVQVTDWSS